MGEEEGGGGCRPTLFIQFSVQPLPSVRREEPAVSVRCDGKIHDAGCVFFQ